MVTDWPEGTPGLHTGAVRFAQTIGIATGGRITIEVFPSGALVRPFETFDAVSAGVADMYHSDEYYFEKKSPAFNFFSAVPFGFTADELFAWVQFGGGQELWDALSGQFNLKPLLCLNTGTQMGGWFLNEIASPDAFKGLRYRMPGLGAEVLRRLGAIAVTLPGSEIVPSLASGALDASEWVGPWLDMAMGTAQGGPLLLLSRVSRAGHRLGRSASTRACGKASRRATSGSSRPSLPVNTRAPWRNSTQTTRNRCASCAMMVT